MFKSAKRPMKIKTKKGFRPDEFKGFCCDKKSL